MLSMNGSVCGLKARTVLPLVSLALTVFFGLVGCTKEPDDNSVIAADSDSDVVATVNGDPITREEMYSEMEQYVPSQVQGFPQNQILQYTAGRVALQHLITNELVVQLAKVAQVPVTNDEVAARYNDIKMVKEAQSTSDFEDLLADQGLTPQQFDFGTITPDVAQFNLVSKGVTVQDSELQSYYQQHLADYTVPDRVHIQRIVLRDQATAQQAYITATNSGSLEEVMGQNISAPLSGGDNAADIPQWINIDNPPSILKGLAVLASTAPDGAILKPIQVANQWWLVKLVSRQSRTILPFQEVEHIVRWNVVSAKAASSGNFRRLQGSMLDMTQQAVITVKPQQYVSLIKQLKNPPLVSPLQGAAPGAGN